MSQAEDLPSGSAQVLTPPAHPNEFNLIWVDMEMTGLDPDSDAIIEIAVIVTDPELHVLAEGASLAVFQPDTVLDRMDAWNKATHGRSGLTERVRASKITESDAEDILIAFLRNYVPKGKSPMCGNTICQDRRFMARSMPRLEAWFHYRNLDVSTFKELCRRWKPEIAANFKKQQKHTALEDIRESIEELRYYREHFIRL